MKKVLAIVFIIFVLSMILFAGTMGEGVKIDYGDSVIYSEHEMKEAVALIVNEVSAWSGCKLFYVAYASDQASMDSLEYCNQLTMEKSNDECIVFKSSFSTSKDSQLAGSFEPDSLYTDWMWYLARQNGGNWKIITYGY